jgi:NADH:ubiquinone oxidoreductase subunit 3 (subunit A)
VAPAISSEIVFVVTADLLRRSTHTAYRERGYECAPTLVKFARKKRLLDVKSLGEP